MRNHPAVQDPRRWRRLRRWMFDAAGWRCQRCNRAGRLELDHIVRVEVGGDWWDPANLQTLCRPCHFAKTADENSRPSPERAAWRRLLQDRPLRPRPIGHADRSRPAR